MDLICTNCGASISSDHINIKTDLAKCENCNTIYKTSELVEDSLKKKISEPPSGTRILYKKGLSGSVLFIHPPNGWSIASLPIMIFASFWISFVAFWTFMAAQASVIFALFSIPFWLVGISMIVGIINSAKSKESIKLGREKIIIEKTKAFKGNRKEFTLSDVNEITLLKYNGNPFKQMGNMKLNARKTTSREILLPAVVTNKSTEFFFESASEEDQQWVAHTLNAVLQKLK